MNHLRSIIGMAAVASTLVVGSTAAPATASTAASRTTSDNLGVCYQAQNKFKEWLDRDQGCDGELVAPTGGVYGLAVTVHGVRQVLYSATNGVTFSSGSDGQQVNQDMATKALRAQISPKPANRHLSYTVTYDGAAQEVSQDAKDNQLAGNGTDTITSIRMKLTTSP
jgi:hypothetical protein